MGQTGQEKDLKSAGRREGRDINLKYVIYVYFKDNNSEATSTDYLCSSVRCISLIARGDAIAPIIRIVIYLSWSVCWSVKFS